VSVVAPVATAAVDVACLTVAADHRLLVLLAQARGGPFAGWWGLPGRLVRGNEPLDEAAAAELRDHAGLRGCYLEQLYTFGHPARDPRGRVVSVAYLGLIANCGRHPLPPGDERYLALGWRPVSPLPPLAYDHATVVRTAVARLRAKLHYTNLACRLLPGAFTFGELQAVYETVLGRPLDRRNFRKKILALRLLRPLGRTRRGPHRPAALWSFRTRRPVTVTVL